jgi:hypothetical protein
MIRPIGYRTLARRLGGAAAALSLLGAVVACGGSDSGDGSGADSVAADSGGGSGLGPVIKMNFDLTGDRQLSGASSSMPAVDNGISPETCADYAKGGKDADDGETHYVLPQNMNDKVGGKQLFVGVTVKDYTGPGTYEKKSLTDQGSPPGIIVDGKLYYTQGGTTSQVVVDDKAGGSWTFAGLSVKNADGTEGGGPTLSGKLTWTCKND